MANYDKFAQFYDAAMATGSNPSEKSALLSDWIHRYQPKAKTLLEFACGTGTILEGLAREFEVSGLDQSAEMLKIAHQKVPAASLYEGDMTSFGIGKKYDVILCMFDSINHLEMFTSWELFFENATKHLVDGGLFIFDMNTIGRLNWLIDQPAWSSPIGRDSMTMDVKRGEGVLSIWNIKIFEAASDSNYKLHEENIAEASFEVERVKGALRRMFSILEVVGENDTKASDNSDRVYYICRKSG